MKRSVLGVSLIALIVAFSAGVLANVPETNQPIKQSDKTTVQEVFFGDWKVSRIAGYNHVSATDEYARESLGDGISFTAEKAFVFNTEIIAPHYIKRSLSEQEFKSRFRLGPSFAKLGVKTTVITEIGIRTRAQLSVEPAKYLYDEATFWVKDENTLLISREGVIFELARTK